MRLIKRAHSLGTLYWIEMPCKCGAQEMLHGTHLAVKWEPRNFTAAVLRTLRITMREEMERHEGLRGQ